MTGPSRRTFLSIAGSTAMVAAAGCQAPSAESDRIEIGSESGSGAQTVPNGVTQFRHSLERWGFYPDVVVPDAVELDWRFDELNTGEHTAAKASAVPLPDGGIVLPGDTGYLTAVDPDGTVRWRAATDTVGRGIHGTPAVADGRVYIGAYDGILYAFDAQTGDELWTTKLGGSIGSSPLYYGGTLYMAVEFPDPEGQMFAVDAEDGTVLWSEPEHRPTDHPHSSPAISVEYGRMVCGSNDGYLYCWRFPGPEFEWRFATNPPGDGEIKGPIATYDGAAFFGSWDNTIYRVDLESGTEDWSFDTGNLSMTGPGIDPRRNTVFMGSHTGNLYALDATTGDEHWRFETGRPLTGCPTVCRERILFGSKDGHLYAVETATGDEVWRVGHDGAVTSTPRVIDTAIYYGERAPDPENGDTDGGGYKLVAADQ